MLSRFPTRKIHWLRPGPLVLVPGLLLLAGCATVFGFEPAPEPEPVVTSAAPVLIAAAEGEVGGGTIPIVGSPYGSYLAGLLAGRQHDLSIAADFMLEALSYDPENEQLLNRAFMLVSGDGRHDKAVELARRLTAADSDHGLAVLTLSVDAVGRGAYQEAEELLAQLPDKGISAITTPLLAGWLRVAAGDIGGAVERTEPLTKKSGFGIFRKLHIALMYDIAGRAEDARAAYEAAIDLAGQPTLRLVWLAGNFFERNGDKARAEALYRGLLENNPNSSVMDSVLLKAQTVTRPEAVVRGVQDGFAETMFNLGSLLSQERAEEVALIYTHLALRLNPDLIVARILLGEILQSQQRGAQAIAVYRKVPDDSPFNWLARLRIAEELGRLERIDEASAELEAIAALRPQRFEPLLRLGNQLRGEERFEEAADAYDRAVARIETPERRHWTLYYFRGIVLERLERWSDAEKDFLFALDLEPEQPFVMNYLAYSWIEKKLHLDKAKGMLARAVELRPDDGYIVDSLGWVYYRLGDYAQGVAFLERAVELRPQDPVINDHLGDAYWRVGRRQEARFQWRRALSLGPEDDLTPEIESKIDSGLNKSPEDI